MIGGIYHGQNSYLQVVICTPLFYTSILHVSLSPQTSAWPIEHVVLSGCSLTKLQNVLFRGL